MLVDDTGSDNYVKKNTVGHNSSSHKLQSSSSSAASRCGVDDANKIYDDISDSLNSLTSPASGCGVDDANKIYDDISDSLNSLTSPASGCGVDDASDTYDDIGDLLNSSISSQISSTISGGANNISHENVMTILEDPSTESLTLKDKLKKWAVDNVDNLYLRTIKELLDILKSEGHTELPLTAHKLLGYKHFVKCQDLVSSRQTVGKYFYFGILNGLKNQLSSIYECNEIKVLIHIDGAAVYKNSRGQLWPVVLKVYNKKYDCPPFVASIYYGDSKPHDVREFLHDFVEECKELIKHGFIIDNKQYTFKILGIIGDGPARAFIKCIIGPTGYCACERCEVNGVTVKKKRVYPELDCPRRTNCSFKTKKQLDHHKEIDSPLLDIPHLDMVKDFPQEIMHLLFLNVMKKYLEKLTLSSSNTKLSVCLRKLLRELLIHVTPYVPTDFQRNIFDIQDLARWKANQFAFVLLYVGAIIFKKVLPKMQYHHFLHLYVGCRILCSSDLALNYVDYAEKQLKTFFELMPTYLGDASQTLNFHGLIHLADDVRHFQMPLTDLSAFFGENFIGKLKHLVTSRARPLPQIINRLNAIQESSKIQLHFKIRECIIDKKGYIFQCEQGNMISLKSLILNDMVLQDKAPDNVVQLDTDQVFRITRLLVEAKYTTGITNPKNLYIEGYCENKRQSVFLTPCPSEEVGVTEIKNFSAKLQIINGVHIKTKCVFIEVEQRNYAISLLHG